MIYLDAESEIYLLEDTLEIKNKQINYFENKEKKNFYIEKKTVFILNALSPEIRIILILCFIISIKLPKYNYKISFCQNNKIDNLTFLAAIKKTGVDSKKDLIQKINKLLLNNQLEAFFEIRLKLIQLRGSNLFDTSNKSILYQYFINHCNNNNLEMNLKNFKKFIFTKSNILGNFFYIDEYILKSRPDVLNHCVQGIFVYKRYESWLIDYGLNEYGLEFLKDEYLKLSHKTTSSPTLQFNSLLHENNGLQSIVMNTKISAPYFTNLKKDVIISVGGALEYNHIYPLKIYKKNNAYKIAVCIWELDVLPKFLNDKFSEFDELWVISNFSSKAFNKLGKKIKILNHKFDELSSSKNKKNIEKNYFLVIFDFASDFYRKNPLMAINAFKAASKPFKNINLIVKCINAEKDLRNFKKIISECKKSTNIKLINQVLSKKEVNLLVSESMGIISLHRAEGLGLNIIDGVLFKKPVILSKYSAPLEYIPEDYKYWVTGKVVKTALNSGAYDFEGLNWFEPDLEDAVKKIEDVILNGPDLTTLISARDNLIKFFSNDSNF